MIAIDRRGAGARSRSVRDTDRSTSQRRPFTLLYLQCFRLPQLREYLHRSTSTTSVRCGPGIYDAEKETETTATRGNTSASKTLPAPRGPTINI